MIGLANMIDRLPGGGAALGALGFAARALGDGRVCVCCGRGPLFPAETLEVDSVEVRRLLSDAAWVLDLPAGYFERALSDELELLRRVVDVALVDRAQEWAALQAETTS